MKPQFKMNLCNNLNNLSAACGANLDWYFWILHLCPLKNQRRLWQVSLLCLWTICYCLVTFQRKPDAGPAGKNFYSQFSGNCDFRRLPDDWAVIQATGEHASTQRPYAHEHVFKIKTHESTEKCVSEDNSALLKKWWWGFPSIVNSIDLLD